MEQNGIFGPLELYPPTKLEDGEEEGASEFNELRKRSQPQPLINGSPAKRPRLSNGYENGTDTSSTVARMMDIDRPQENGTPYHQSHQSDNNHAYPSPLEGERPSTPLARTDGLEQGTQVEKVDQLSQSTIFLKLAEDGESHSGGGAESTSETPAANAAAVTNGSSAENAPILVQCGWNPKDPSSLAAAGTDALARVWTVSHATAPESGLNHVPPPPPSLSLLLPDVPRTTTVTALAWASDGASIATANDYGNGSRGVIDLWAVDGAHIESVEIPEPPVVKLLWNPGNTALLALSPDNNGARVTVYDTFSKDSMSYLVPDIDMMSSTPDAPDVDWTSDSEFVLCGGNIFCSLHCANNSISLVRKFDTKSEDSFTKVLFDGRANLAATASDKGVLDVSLSHTIVAVSLFEANLLCTAMG